MSDITKKITYGELENKEYQTLFKFTNGETVLGVINYDNGDVYMGEIKPDEKYDGKRDRRRHGYGKVFPKRGKVVDGEWHLGQVIGKSVTFDKKGKRTVEVRGSDPSFRSILYSYYLNDDNKYGGDNYNGLYKDKFWDGDFKDVLRRGELREQLFNGTSASTTAASSAQKSAPTKEKAPTKNNAVPKEPASKAKIERIEYASGNVYEGEMKDGLRNGVGTFRWSNGDVYIGEYVNDVRQGKGKFLYASGNVYEGDFFNGNFHGYGVFRWADGDVYEGEWKNDERHGNGKYIYADGSYYTGVWENGDIIDSTKIDHPAPSYASESVKPAAGAKIERMEYDGGDFYEGEIVDGYRHGKGKYTWADGSEYEGDWVKGKKCGFGVYRSYSKNEKDGSTYLSYIYEGEWKDGKKHGQGIAKKYKIYHLFGTPFMTWSHEGGYANGDMHGHGIYKEWNVPNDTGRVHEGEWVNNKRQGRFVWEYEPSVTGKKYIDFYDQGHSVVFGIDYDPSINTLEEAKRVKAENDAVRDRVIAERRAREAAEKAATQSRTTATTHFDDDAMSDLRYLYEMKSSGRTFSWSAEEQQKYQDALLGRKGDRDGVALTYVKQRVYANSLSSLSQEDVNFCIYLLNEIIPREHTRDELAICYYRKDWVKEASGSVSKRGLAIAKGEIWMLCDIKPNELPYSDEIMARRLVDKIIFRLQNTADSASVLRNSNYLQDKLLLAEAYLSYAKKERRQYQITEIEEDLITLKTLMK